MHRTRKWCLSTVPTLEQLAEMLTQRTWTLCSAFCVEGHPDYLFLNDSTSEDGAQEYAVVKRPPAPGEKTLQIESITFSWCSLDRAADLIRSALAGNMDYDIFIPVVPTIQTLAEHGHCPLCA